MDKTEIELNGGVVFGFTLTPDGSVAPDVAQQNEACGACHGNERGQQSCDTERKQHLTEGRVSQALWEFVTFDTGVTAGTTCGW